MPKRIPEKWNEYKVQYRYKSTIYNITISNNNSEKIVLYNGEKYEKDYINLKDENKIENIEIKM